MHKRNYSKLLLTGTVAICALIAVVLVRASYFSRQDIDAEIRVNSTNKMDEPLTLHWKLTNKSQTPVCIYSSYLSQKNYVGIIIDPDTREIEIRFTAMKLSKYVPVYFPSPEFMQVDPGKSIEGVFTSKETIREIRDVSKVNAPTGLTPEQAEQLGTRPAAGVWSSHAVFGYGYGDFDSVEKEFKSTNTGDEHPINQVVRWQKLVRSKPLSIEFIE